MQLVEVDFVNRRFQECVIPDVITGCWNWTLAKNARGYGRIYCKIIDDDGVERNMQLLAHRASWMVHNGPIPVGDGPHGMVIMHKCDNPACVNPAHLEIGTQADNVQDMLNKGRKVVGEWQKRKGVDHFNSAFKDQADIDLICATEGQTKELAERYGVTVSAIKRIRRRNGVIKPDADKFKNKDIPQHVIDHIRSTPPGTRGLGKLYGLGKTTVANIRKGLTHAG